MALELISTELAAKDSATRSRSTRASFAFVAALSLTACAAKAEFNTTTLPTPMPAPQPAQVVAAPQPAGDAVLEGDRIKIARPIFYDTDKDQIKPESFPVLAAVGGILSTHPEIIGLVVEGHTDNQGTFDHNRELSERRAGAVVRYLASIGVKQPMQAPGYGATSPICGGVDEPCRQQNRRVEFRVKRAP